MSSNSNSPHSSPSHLPPIGSFDKAPQENNPSEDHLRMTSPSAILFGLSQAATMRIADDQRGRERDQMMNVQTINNNNSPLSTPLHTLHRFTDQINISSHNRSNSNGESSMPLVSVCPPRPNLNPNNNLPQSNTLPPPISSLNIKSKSNGKSIGLFVSPVEYQVVSYNIYPSPEVVFSHASDLPITVSAFLVCCNEQTGDLHEIPEGFTNGDVQVLKSGQTRVSFPALHLNRMTPIKTALRQAGFIRGTEFAILFRADDLELVSQFFKLVSASNRIPGANMRPRTPKPSSEMIPKQMDNVKGVSPPTPPDSGNKSDSDHDSPDQNLPDSKRRKKDEEEMEMSAESYVRVHVKGEENARGFIVVTPKFTLKDAREEIMRSPNYPKHFHFWFAKMKTIVQHHQEDLMKASSGIDKETLILNPYEPAVQSTESLVMDLWLKHKDKSPLLPILQVIRSLVSLNGAEYNQNELRLITSGINHFLVNTSKHQELNVVSLEDFKLFLKFFGPTNIFRRVLNVYGEGKPGYYLVRYSESQLQEGFYAFNVNKGNQDQDIVENYVLPYLSDQGCFIFKDKQYLTISDFTKDPDFAHILVNPLPKVNTDKTDEFRFQPDKPNANGHYAVMEKLGT